MATLSTIVDDSVIDKFKDSITEWKRLRAEVAMALDAGLQSPYSLKDIDAKIDATTKIIETYTGKPYRP